MSNICERQREGGLGRETCKKFLCSLYSCMLLLQERNMSRERRRRRTYLCGFPSMRERPECVELCGERGTHGHEWVDAEPHYFFFVVVVVFHQEAWAVFEMLLLMIEDRNHFFFIWRKFRSASVVVNMRPAGQKWPARGFNVARLMNFESQKMTYLSKNRKFSVP